MFAFSIIMTKAIADRLAEAFAEHLHELVRKDYWGYNKDEELDTTDLIKIKYPVRESIEQSEFDLHVRYLASFSCILPQIS